VLIPSWFALQTFGSSHASSGPPVQVRPARRATVPNLVGMRACKAERVALAAGLIVRHVPRRRCNAQVVVQKPAPGSIIPRDTPRWTVKLRLARPG
jgi:beta-lactam-binding protein with PASTA domain